MPRLRAIGLPRAGVFDGIAGLVAVITGWWAISSTAGRSIPQIVASLFFSGWDNQGHFTTFANTAVLGSTTSERITTLVTDIVTSSADSDAIRQSDEVGDAFRSLRAYMFREVYLASPASDESARARAVVTALFRMYLDDPSLLPPGGDADPVTRATDFVSGMTDRYACRQGMALLGWPIEQLPKGIDTPV